MRKQIARACTALLLALGALPIVTTPVAAHDHAGACRDALFVARTAGEFAVANSRGYNGVEAIGTSYTTIPETCMLASGDTSEAHSLTSFWIGIQDGQNFNDAIVQVGLMRCDGQSDWWQGTDPCDSGRRGTWRYWYAFGGCNANKPWARDIGAATAPGLDHKLAIIHTSSIIKIIVNGDVRAEIGGNQMSCWSGTDNKVSFACETADGGDSCGGMSGAYTKFWNIRLRYADTYTWTGVNTVSTPCANNGVDYARYHCIVHSNNNSISLYSGPA